MHFFNTSHQLVIIRFTFRTTNDLTDLREKNVHRTYCLSILVLLHIEGFDFLRIISQNHRTFEVIFHQIAFVLGSQVYPPVNREFELVTFRNGIFQNLDTIRIRQTNEIILQYTLQTFNQALIEHIVQELHIIRTVIQRPFHTIFDELFCQVHIVGNVVERNFRLNHPELCQMAGSIGVFGTESRTECVDSTQSSGRQFTFQLTGYCQTCLLAEEVVIIRDRTSFVFLQVIQIHGSYLKHLSGTFTVGTCDNRCMEIEKSLFMEKLVNSNRHVVTNAEHCTKGIGTRTQVSDLAQEFHGVTFFLQWICIVASTQHFDFFSLHFHLLTGTHRFHHYSVHTNTSPGSNQFQHLFIEISQIYYDLHIIYCRTVIQCDKVNLFATSAGANPSFHIDHSANIFALQQINNFCSTNLFHKTFLIQYYILLKRPHAEVVYFCFRQVTPVSAAQTFFGQSGKEYTVEFYYFISQ